MSCPISRPGSSASALTVAARDIPSPGISTAPSSGSIFALSPTLSLNPERSLSHASSFATTISTSAPITPTNDDPSSPTIAPPTPDSDRAASPIHLGDLAKQLATDSPVDPRFESFDESTSRFPQDRDSSIYDDSEPSTRISVALSDGGAGIGFSLLQNFAGGSDDSDDEDGQSVRRTLSSDSTVEGPPGTARSESHYSQSPRSAVHPPLSVRSDSPESTAQPPPSARSDSHYSESPVQTRLSLRSESPADNAQPPPAAQSDSPASIGQPPVSARSGSHYSQSPVNAPLSLRTDSPASIPQPPLSARSGSHYSQSPVQPLFSGRSDSVTSLPQPPFSARSGSQYSDSLPSAHSGSDYGGEDWEGADDIYDDYRYSRYSMASKMSRFSKGSMYTVASTSEVVPPIPTELSRGSLDSREHGRKGSKETAHSKLSESVSTPAEDLLSAGDSEETMSRLQKNRPAPLTFRKEPEPSPLLHATFGSPQASPTAPTATTASFASPTLMSPVYPTNTGAATNLRQRLERERDEQDDDLPSDREAAGKGRLGQELTVVERDPSMPHTAASQAAEIVHGPSETRSTPPPTPAIPPSVQRSSNSSPRSPRNEKRMMVIANADPVPDGPPPPPYSATPEASSSQVPPPQPAPVLPLTPAPAPMPMPMPMAIPRPGPSTSPPTHPTARPIDPNRPPADPQGRQSLFLPHPGAPKPTTASAGPMYGRQPAAPPVPTGPPAGSVFQVLQIAFVARREGRPAPPTIYGRFEYDLSTSIGPVPITFSLEPQNNIPANRARPPMPWTGAQGPSRTGLPASGMGMGGGPPGGELAGRRSVDPAGRQNAMSLPGRMMSPPARVNTMPRRAG
ncbi:uncharacterized protein TRAVEDRAFT_54319 [Trametes versicolor FP-101664 SS1]|uniref:Uncharacterized protein n=1 Tax=Trametes versicolor (strain FP-101664) TaxID=717944 RepID=R7S7A1_TRAVS|nr:uncharacterized protein TRAVEDRAFT_54319 [Trametes versicolor FP-101664 SS1]EIW51903.1 hypothetical protein TRAVEDRAFT_54319 [Trametes versicolor FP-101664 SS1]